MREQTPSRTEGKRDAFPYAGAEPGGSGTAYGDPPADVEKSEAGESGVGEAAGGRSGAPEGGTAQEGEDLRLITRDHVRELLASRDDGSTLVVLEGRARVVPAGELGSQRYAGALEVMSGEDLTRQAGQGPYSEQDLDALAARLETVISHLGG
ncbi:hypothetical protein AB0N31_04960 [Streptomyces sp. NPDC051051]|uniref:hypothetical protein n=1 Tax=Streptomyces sp. NPDC051051 TaxID=3155666 RepID=UPI003430ABC9